MTFLSLWPTSVLHHYRLNDSTKHGPFVKCYDIFMSTKEDDDSFNRIRKPFDALEWLDRHIAKAKEDEAFYGKGMLKSFQDYRKMHIEHPEWFDKG